MIYFQMFTTFGYKSLKNSEYLTKSEKEILHIHNSSNMSSERLCITRFS